MENLRVFDDILNVVEANTKKTENYLSSQDEVSAIFRDSIKSLYDFTKSESNRSTAALPELITDGFDAEQIWQQLELQNEGEFPHLLTGISKALTSANRLNLPIKLTQNNKQEEEEEEQEEDQQQNQLDIEEASSKNGSSDSDDVSEGLDRPKKRKKLKNEQRKKTRPSVVDDTFFKLQELDEYLNKEDKKAMQDGKLKEDEESDDADDESVDLFDYVSESGEEEEDPRLVKFKDFFDQPESDGEHNYEQENEEEEIEDEEGEEEEEDDMKRAEKRVKFTIPDEKDSDDSDDREAETRPEFKSSLESRQERLRMRIEKLEDEAISEKPWQLKGEVDAASRPQNSLLEEHVEFDITSRPAPVITEQTTMKLEDIIRQRIKDKAWDDVEKKIKPVETPMEYKKKLILDQEKSKVSLAQIYENEYLKQREALDPDNEDKEVEEPKEHIEIRQMMQSLFNKLDALSNFHYTPKLARPEIKIVSNLPAVTMEEVAPVATSEATLLAPEEIRAKSRGDVIGKGERTETDMNRERRKKKLKQRERQKANEKKEKMVEKLRPGLGNKYSKEKASKLIENLSKERNISKIDESNEKGAKSSTAFFNQLQDQVKSQIKSKTGITSKKKERKSISAVKLKL